MRTLEDKCTILALYIFLVVVVICILSVMSGEILNVIVYFKIIKYQTGICFIDEGYTIDRITIKNVPVDVDINIDGNLPNVTIYPTPGNDNINSEYFMKNFPHGVDCFADIATSKAYLKQVDILEVIFIIILLNIIIASPIFSLVIITIVFVEDMNMNHRVTIIVFLCMVIIIVSSILLQINTSSVDST